MGLSPLQELTVSPPKRVTAYTANHADEDAKKSQTCLPEIEAVVFLEYEREGLAKMFSITSTQ